MKVLFYLFLLMPSLSFAQLSVSNALHDAEVDPFRFTVQYSGRTDLLDETEPRLYEHNFSFNTIYNYTPKLRFGALLNVGYFTLDNEFVETQQGYGRARPSLSLFSTYRLNTKFFTAHNVGVGYVAFLDRYNEFEGYKGVPSVRTTFVKRVWGNRVMLIQTFNASYLMNSFDNNSLGQPNRTYAVSASPILSINVVRNLSFLLGFGIRWDRLTDGNTDYRYFNSQTLSYRWKSVSLFARHFNGGFTEDGTVDLWHVDKHRKFVDAGISYEF